MSSSIFALFALFAKDAHALAKTGGIVLSPLASRAKSAAKIALGAKC
jgi:hypothetical protein